jgi:hypothetical protein
MAKTLPILKYWLSNEKFTCLVEVDDLGMVVGGAPIINVWIGQRWWELWAWSRRRFKGTRVVRLNV